MSKQLHFIKYAGGKRQLLPELLRRVPDLSAARYHEPFVGGGALFFALRERGLIGKKSARLSDVNEELINTYLVVRDQVEALIGYLDETRSSVLLNSEANYYRVRAEPTETLTWVGCAARFLFLNRCGFNGLHRQNRDGKNNVPYGHHPGRSFYDADTLRACSAALQGVEIECVSFERVHPHVRPGDFVFMDPPYVPVSETASFSAYTAGGFTMADQRRVVQAALRLARRGVRVLISNSHAARGLYTDPAFLVEEVQAKRSINSRGDRRGNVTELLVSAGDPR